MVTHYIPYEAKPRSQENGRSRGRKHSLYIAYLAKQRGKLWDSSQGKGSEVDSVNYDYKVVYDFLFAPILFTEKCCRTPSLCVQVYPAKISKFINSVTFSESVVSLGRCCLTVRFILSERV